MGGVPVYVSVYWVYHAVTFEYDVVVSYVQILRFVPVVGIAPIS